MSFRVSLVRIPLLSVFSSSRGSVAARSALILQLSQDGVEAFSECVTEKEVSSTGEDNASALRLIRKVLGGKIRGHPPSPTVFLQVAKRVRGNPMAKAAVEMLLWDYEAKAAGRPLDEVLGDSRGYADAGIALGLVPVGELITRIDEALGRGYRRIKVKIDRKSALERLGQIRDSFPEIRLSADANGCFTLRRDIATLKRIDKFDLQYLEQPLAPPGLFGHSKLAEKVSTPICLDESVTTLESAEEAIGLGAARVINIKPGRVGGLHVAMDITRIAREAGVNVWVGGMLETGVGRAFNVALASQRQVDLPGDTSPNDRYFERDIVKNPFAMRDGRVKPNQGPGIGVKMDGEFLRTVTVGSWKVF